MAVLTTRDIFVFAALGCLAALGSLIFAAALGIGLLNLYQRATSAWHAHRDQRRTLKAARRQLSTFTTIDDLKE